MCNAAYGVGRGFDDYRDYPFNQEIGPRAMMYNSELGSVVMELGRRMLLPIPGPAPFGLRRTAREITAEGLAWLDGVSQGNPSETAGSRRPFFLFLNFMDVHDPYLPAPDAARKFWTQPIPSLPFATAGSGWNAMRARNAAPPEQRQQRQRELDEVRLMAWTPSSAVSSAGYAQRAGWQTPGSSSPPTMANTSASMTCSATGRACTTSRLMFLSSSSLRLVPERRALTVRRGFVGDGSPFPSHSVTCPGR
jgi:hypothetical protein